MLKKTIQTDLNNAIKLNDEITRNTLRMLLSFILNKEKDKRYKISKEEPELGKEELDEKSNLTEEETLEAVFSEVKKRKEAVKEYERGQRNDLADKEKKELEILKRYMPEQLSEQELKSLIKEAIDKLEIKDIKGLGKVMAELMPKVKGRTDGSEISRIVKELLQS